MSTYPEEYLDDVVENQGKLFYMVSQNYPDKDIADFINTLMLQMSKYTNTSCITGAVSTRQEHRLVIV